MTKEDLKERLFVAEKVMKSLFQRNKEIEMHNEELREKALEAGDATPLQKQSSVTNCFNCGEL